MARPRKPTHLKIVAGTDRPDRRHKHEPQPRGSRLAPPGKLSPRARLAWVKASRLLHEMGVLTVADSFALQALCEAISDEHEARTALAKRVTIQVPNPSHDPENPAEPPTREQEVAAAGAITYVTTGKSGAMVRMRPEVAAIADADRRIGMWLAKFGLTPADRSRVGANPPPEENPFASF